MSARRDFAEKQLDAIGVDVLQDHPVELTLQWITERMFVGTGARYADEVVIRLFELG